MPCEEGQNQDRKGSTEHHLKESSYAPTTVPRLSGASEVRENYMCCHLRLSFINLNRASGTGNAALSQSIKSTFACVYVLYLIFCHLFSL